MISKVSITNFKSIGEPGVDLELKPLTLLVGPNGGGKSSILEAIAVAAQRNTSGRITKFPSAGAVYHKGEDAPVAIDVCFAPCNKEENGGYRLSFGKGLQFKYEFLSENEQVIEKTSKLSDQLNSQSFLISSVRGQLADSIEARGSPNWVGTYGQDILLLLAMIFGQRKHKKAANQISRWAHRFGISDLHAGYVGGDQASSDYEDTELKVALNLALSSSGSRQILTVITQLAWSARGSLLMIEEPEISLHPKAQIDVLEMFAEAIKQDNKQIVATTHSHVLLQALGYAVHKRWLKRQDIAVYHIEKSVGGTNAKLLPLRRNGYIRGWVPSFSEVEKELLQEWAKTLPRA